MYKKHKNINLILKYINLIKKFKNKLVKHKDNILIKVILPLLLK